MFTKKEIKQYQESIKAEQVQAYCPDCKNVYYIFPEHAERCLCDSCNKALVLT